MQIKNYIKKIIDIISANSYVKLKNLSFEERPPNAIYLSGYIVFIDGSKLYFKEFIVFKSGEPNILKYGYNYTTENDSLIFRYDNAFDPEAKAFSSYPEHKHMLNKLLPAAKPVFEAVLKEISGCIEIKD